MSVFSILFEFRRT